MNMNKPKPLSVLMVIESYLPSTGGTECQLSALAGELKARNVQVEVLTEQRYPEWPLLEEVAGTRVHRLPYPRIRFLGPVVILLRACLFLLTQGRHFHIFHVHTVSFLATLTVIVGRILGKVVVLKAGGAWELERVLNPTHQRHLLYRTMLTILRHADTWIAISTYMRRAMEAAGLPRERIVMIPNGVNTKRFTPPADQIPHGQKAAQAPRVVFVGRLVKEKALPVLLQAWTIVHRHMPDAYLDIVGEGSLEQELKTLTEHLGLTATVCFRGFHEDVIPFLQAANVFVLSSYVEGLANTLLEAMAMSLPVVATRISGSEDVVVDGETGLLVPPGDADSLAQALSELLKAPERAITMGARAQQRIIELYSLEQVATVYLNLYEHLLKEQGERLCAASPVS
jgi:glycosyltransferase involved in cell wall biosynthesis